METNTAKKLQHELNSLQGLSIINIVCSSLALSFGVYFLIPNLISVVTTRAVTVNQVGLVTLGAIAFVVAIRWLISSAQIIDVTSKLNDSLKKQKKNKTLDDEALTGLIVKMMAAYRENKPTLQLMITISRVAGVLFAVSALFALIGLITSIALNASVWATIVQALNLAMGLATASACFIIPRFFGKYSLIWDQRLKQTVNAEAQLQKQLGEE
jgi:hypothetical protein